MTLWVTEDLPVSGRTEFTQEKIWKVVIEAGNCYY